MLALSDYLTSQSKKYETPVEEPTPAASEVGAVGITPHKVSSEVNVEVEREVPSKEVIPAKDFGSMEMPKQPTVIEMSAEKRAIETLPLKCSSEKKLVDTSPFISPAITLSGIASTTPSQSGGTAIDKMQSLQGDPKINSDEGRSREHMLPQPVETTEKEGYIEENVPEEWEDGEGFEIAEKQDAQRLSEESDGSRGK
ncbi:unnamed protein product [Strongylus vulgaris]|uniref:Uncharacterized protein n=1 Tax=Strongylus vulgaris TaxID=40348 RepID=A0A3P7LIX3_STRVU|nr:unnamed protein product [Strongylus vulgaris]